ncbi:MAG: hypothetical protein EKK48_27845 [Candidatus Melainabacteria bacterium]|nr:MAG: hypothetical protein EKK48_27845 [Candidatus Melainabacteria bacterium]
MQFIEAVTDKTVPQEIQDLLQGVVSLERKGNDIELTKEDGSKVMAGGETHFGATVIGDFSEARDKVALKFGPEVGALIDEFVGVKASGSHLEVIRTGPEIEDIDLSEKKINRQLPLRRVRLSKISLDVDVADSHPVLRNITGIEAVPNTALEIPIVLKEFSRCKNSNGDDVFTFGVKNPIPFVKPFKKLLGIKEIIPLTWTVKRPDAANKEIGVKVPAEQLGERIGAETFKQLGEKTGAATTDQQLQTKTGAATTDQQLQTKTGAATTDQQLQTKTGAATTAQPGTKNGSETTEQKE